MHAPHEPDVDAILASVRELPPSQRWAELVNAAVALHGAGRLDDATVVLEPVLAETRGRDDDDARFALSAALVNRAIVDVAHGDAQRLRNASAMLDAAALHAQALGLGARLGTIEVNRARIASLEGRVADARSALERAEAHYRDADSPADVAWAQRALGASLASVGQLEEAAVLQARARDGFREAGDVEQADMTEVGLVAIRAELGDRIETEERERLERLAGKLSAEAGLQMLGNLGNIAARDGDLDGAERLWGLVFDRSRNEGWRVDEARARLALAGVLRRRGELEAALDETEAAGETLRALGAWEAAARADVNAALLLGLLADRGGERAPELRARAAGRVVRAVDRLDRLRHALPTAAARRALLRRRYPQLFVAALEAALKTDEPDLVAALVERARIQPVLAAHRDATSGFVEPRALRTRPSALVLEGERPIVELADLAARLAGPEAHWIGWWRGDADLLVVDVQRDRTLLETNDFPHGARQLLDGCLARPRERESEAARGDRALAARLALRRAASCPLLADSALADRLTATLLPSTRRAAAAAEVSTPADLDEILWSLARAVLPSALLAQGEDGGGSRLPLVVAPPPVLADVPWALLPLRARASDEPAAAVPRLLDVADIVVGLPASLASQGAVASHGTGTLAILDPLGDLPHARRLALDGVRLGTGGDAAATRENVLASLRKGFGLLVVAAHIRAGVADDPASAALALHDGAGASDYMTVSELANAGAPQTCVVVGCDASGGVVGDEWTGLATALLWAGATWVVASTWPTTEDRHTAASDRALATTVQAHGARAGLWSWQRERLSAWRAAPGDPAHAPYRWAGMIVCGRCSAA